MWIVNKIDQLINAVEDFLEKGERKIVRPYQAPSAKPLGGAPAQHGIKSDSLSFHTGKVRYQSVGSEGSTEKPRDHATYSEHVIIHNGKPIGMATVHHSHPSDHGRVTGGGARATYHDHSVEIHAPGVHPDAHGLLRQKVKDHVNSKEFKGMVDKHNEEKHGYVKPKGWMYSGKKDGKKDQ